MSSKTKRSKKQKIISDDEDDIEKVTKKAPRNKVKTPKKERVKHKSSPIANQKVIERRKVGRPFVTMEELNPDWRDTMLQLASQGYSDVEIRAALCYVDHEDDYGKYRSFSIQRWNRLQDRVEEFAVTYKICRVLCEAWWMMKGRRGIDSTYFNTAVWFINMKNRFGWKDKQEIQHNIQKTLADQIAKGRQRVLDAVTTKGKEEDN